MIFIQLEFCNRHRRNGPQIVRIDDIQKSLGQFGQVIIKTKMDPCRKKRERLQKPLYMRISAAVGLQQQPARYRGILSAELVAHLAHVAEFAFVHFQESLPHT